MNNYTIEKLKRSRTDEELLENLRLVAMANDGKVTQKIYAEYRRNIDTTIAEASTICRQIGWNEALSLIGITCKGGVCHE